MQMYGRVSPGSGVGEAAMQKASVLSLSGEDALGDGRDARIVAAQAEVGQHRQLPERVLRVVCPGERRRGPRVQRVDQGADQWVRSQTVVRRPCFRS